ncbi:MAG TPA: hypothetical protein VN963_09945, partial [bacterium]|nr:hypothetical protein [bacterium]
MFSFSILAYWGIWWAAVFVCDDLFGGFFNNRFDSMDLVSGKIKRRYFSPIFMRRVLFSFLLLALSGCGLDETLQRSDKALSLEEASKDATVSSLPFPPSTTDVYYVYHAGGMQEWEFFVR